MKQFLVVGDIHACDVDPASSSAPSYVSTVNSLASGFGDPLSELLRMINDHGLAPDCILCAGDITNRSNPGSLSYAWRELHNVASSLHIPLISTIGNHDLDSRYQSNKFDPRGYVMSLSPKLPSQDRTQYLEFWAENMTLMRFDSCNIMVVNTAAYHGGGTEVATELEHGRISHATVRILLETLQNAPVAAVNILLCHHHLEGEDRDDPELVGATRGGNELMQALGEAAGRWIIVHGHKHIPDLFYGPGGANSPVVLCCASFSAQVNVDARNKNPNQVHLLACDPDGALSQGLSCAGYVKSWTWLPGIGWRVSHGGQGLGLPRFAGFGYRASLSALARRVEAFLSGAGFNRATWEAASQEVPEIERLIPRDFRAFERELGNLGVAILSDRDGSFAEIGRRA